MKLVEHPTKYNSVQVEKYSDIKDDAEEMLKILDAGIYRGRDRVGAIALSHCQVSEHPKAFFVIDKSFRDVFNGRRIIINAKILETKEEVDFSEACLSFPTKGEVRTKRFKEILVEYQVPTATGELRHPKKEWVTDLQAFVFQHEIDHSKGQDIHNKFKHLHEALPTSGKIAATKPA